VSETRAVQETVDERTDKDRAKIGVRIWVTHNPILETVDGYRMVRLVLA
jgi:hypothetical protein